MRLAIVPGSFDPMTLGHLDLVKNVAKRYDEVVVAVMINPAKRYCFDLETRVEIAKKTVEELGNVSVISDKGLLIDLYDRLGASAVCKGWRNEADYAYEQKHALYNRAHNPKAETLYLPADPAYDHISSTLVRERIEAGQSIDDIVPAAVAEYVRRMGK